MAQKELKIFFDLDGTLIDVSNRHHTVYNETVKELGGSPLDKQAYWDQKRAKDSWDKILANSGLSADDETAFLNKFIPKIESQEYLKMDTLFPDSINVLDSLAKKGSIYLVSLRRNHENLVAEPNWLSLSSHFTKILSGHSESEGSDVKARIIREELACNRGVIIGDTEADVRTGQELGLITIAVASGIRSQEYLTSLRPDFIVQSVKEVLEIDLPG